MNDYTREHVDEGILLRYVDGELDEMDVELVEDHITACEKCRDRYDDLAAASDSLTAFLRKSDYPDRALAYRPRGVGGAWWAHPLARAAALALLLGGLVAPVTYLTLRRAPNDLADDVSVRFAAAPPRPAAGTGSTRSVAVPPADGKPMADELEAFTIDLSSWQAGGVLKLFFTDGDMFNYSGRNANNTAASFNTMTNRAYISTTASSEADHEIWIPRQYDPEKVLVRIAGRPVSFSVVSGTVSSGSGVVTGATFRGVATIQLSSPGDLAGEGETGMPMAVQFETFTIDVSSWQSAGVLRLLFTDSDVFVYRDSDADNTVASFNTMTNQAHIRTTANSEADHEIWIPRYYDPENILVRIAGRPVSFEVSIPVGSIMLPPPSRTAARSTFHGVATIQLSR